MHRKHQKVLSFQRISRQESPLTSEDLWVLFLIYLLSTSHLAISFLYTADFELSKSEAKHQVHVQFHSSMDYEFYRKSGVETRLWVISMHLFVCEPTLRTFEE